MSSGFLDRLRRQWGLQTLGLHLVLGYVLLFVASTALLATLAYVVFLYFIREPDRAFMQAQAYELARAYERGGLAALRVELISGAPDERREELLVRVVEEGDRTLLLYNPDNWKPAELELLSGQPLPRDETWVRLGTAEDEDALEAFALRLPDGHVLQVGMDADLREDALESMRAVFLVIALPLLVLALLGGAFMAYRALQPLRQLVATLNAVIETGDVETRVPVEGARGEFTDIIHLFNRMLDRIEALVAGMRGTLDNVAHDLRTPMTRLRGRAELALQEERDVHTYREALADSLETSETVMTMLDTIMEVAEAEAGTLPLRLEPLRVSDVVNDVIELYRFVAEDEEVALHAHVPPDLVVTADRSRLRQALANLIDNAVKYTPAGGQVDVEAGTEAGGIWLRVRDTGAGISAADLPRIWDRLYRGDLSRSARGLGLGLSLVKAIVTAHGGRVEVESTPGVGSVFTVHLPTDGLLYRSVIHR